MKLWGSRFHQKPTALLEAFNNSLDVDRAMALEDITASLAYARGLRRAGLLSGREFEKLKKAFQKILRLWKTGRNLFEPGDEDIHSGVERLLTRMTGEAGKKIHTGRSRNSQVVQDERLFLKRTARELIALVVSLQRKIIVKAQRAGDVVIPGYTHLRQAQPLLFAHYLLALFFMLQRDRERMQDSLKRIDVLVLGSGALAGSGFPLDRPYLARLLGLKSVSPNSLDAVADRDFIIEFLADLAILSVHLSRFAEDWIIWSSDEFGFLELHDSLCTGSSIMPQKKNPDALELIRGKTGRFIGNLNTLLVVLKGLPLAYNKDLQEDKEPLLDSINNMRLMLKIFAQIVDTLKINEQDVTRKMDPYIFATDLADYLARKKVPFRKSHEIVGRLVKHLSSSASRFQDLGLRELKTFSPKFKKDVYRLLEGRRSIMTRNIPGGTGPASVQDQIRLAKKLISLSIKV